jgi:NAD(P)-dependent dehydrogenase (short-subunit alcohol dehydrogenase family)
LPNLSILKNKVAIVTGSSRGIGKAIAVKLAQEGVKVIVTARTEISGNFSPGTIHETVELIHNAGGEAFPIVCNIRDEANIDHLISETLKKYKTIDILINNAGIGNYQSFQETTLKQWELMLDINIKAPIMLMQKIIPTMINNGAGSIVNISSHAANNIFSSTLSTDNTDEVKIIGQSYGASKAALERLSWGLAAELGCHNIAVNVLKPLKPVLTEGFIAQRPDGDYSSWSTPEAMATAATILAAQLTSGGLRGTSFTAEELLKLYGS